MCCRFEFGPQSRRSEGRNSKRDISVTARSRDLLVLVKPETGIRWNARGFRLDRTRKSQRRGRCPKIEPDFRELIRRRVRENPTWRAPRTHGQLLKLRFQLSEATLSRYMPRGGKRPSPGWCTLLENHTAELVSIDFLVVPTTLFPILNVFVVLEHEERRVVHFHVTDSPTARWTAQQRVEALPYDSAPQYIVREGHPSGPPSRVSRRPSAIEDASSARKGCARDRRRTCRESALLVNRGNIVRLRFKGSAAMDSRLVRSGPMRFGLAN